MTFGFNIHFTHLPIQDIECHKHTYTANFSGHTGPNKYEYTTEDGCPNKKKNKNNKISSDMGSDPDSKRIFGGIVTAALFTSQMLFMLPN